MTPEALLQFLFQAAHRTLNGTLDGVTDEVANTLSSGAVSTIGAQYVHLLTSEDMIVNAILKGGAPLMATQFAGQTGSAETPQFFAWGEWGRTAQVNIEAAKTYGQAVAASTHEYLGTLSAEALDEPLDLTQMGFGVMPRAALVELALQQVYLHTGEISALKGLQGLKGYAL